MTSLVCGSAFLWRAVFVRCPGSSTFCALAVWPMMFTVLTVVCRGVLGDSANRQVDGNRDGDTGTVSASAPSGQRSQLSSHVSLCVWGILYRLSVVFPCRIVSKGVFLLTHSCLLMSHCE